jgi:AbrB family looped-hinge helix DNA binding protein
MTTFTTQVDQNGRVLIPASVRKSKNWVPGVKLSIVLTDDGVKVISKTDKLLEAQKQFQKQFGKGGSTEEFLEFRRLEARREEELDQNKYD